MMTSRVFFASCTTGIILIVVGCATPILYKPTGDPARPVFSIKIPRSIETVSGLSQDVRKVAQPPRKGSLIESLELEKEWVRGERKASYLFLLSFDEDDAMRRFVDYGKILREGGRPFAEGETGGTSYLITYVERPRSGGGGWYLPMNYYAQSAMFRFGNLVVRIESRSANWSSDLLTEPLEYLAQLLEKSFGE
jgi:hypothetical protein